MRISGWVSSTASGVERTMPAISPAARPALPSVNRPTASWMSPAVVSSAAATTAIACLSASSSALTRPTNDGIS